MNIQRPRTKNLPTIYCLLVLALNAVLPAMAHDTVWQRPQPSAIPQRVAFYGQYGLATTPKYHYSHRGAPSFYGQPNIPYDALKWALADKAAEARKQRRSQQTYAMRREKDRQALAATTAPFKTMY